MFRDCIRYKNDDEIEFYAIFLFLFFLMAEFHFLSAFKRFLPFKGLKILLNVHFSFIQFCFIIFLF